MDTNTIEAGITRAHRMRARGAIGDGALVAWTVEGFTLMEMVDRPARGRMLALLAVADGPTS